MHNSGESRDGIFPREFSRDDLTRIHGAAPRGQNFREGGLPGFLPEAMMLHVTSLTSKQLQECFFLDI